MEPNLLVGDRLFVTKFSYGYSKHSFPFSPPLFKGRIFTRNPDRGDVIVFKTPADNRTDYIKRLIALPGDTIQFNNGEIYINDNSILRTIENKDEILFCGNSKISVKTFKEKLPNGAVYKASYRNDISFTKSDKYIVPEKHYFFLGDNRDCSKDSRYLSEVGYVHQDNLVGKAQFLFFSSNPKEGSIFNIFRWNKILRLERFLQKIN